MQNDLMSRSAVIDRYYAEYEAQDICDGDEDRDWLKKCIEEAPAVDAVEVVRCKDCKHSFEDDFDGSLWCCRDREIEVVEGHFCSYGERRADDG